MPESIETVIVGGGQGGLATSYHLTQQGREHVILEAASQPAAAWRNLWDSFTLVTPNFTVQMPGAEYDGDDPDGFLPRDQVVSYFEDYIRLFDVPIRYDTRVTSVEKNGAVYHVRSDGATIEAINVVMATGLFQKPKVPSHGAHLPAGILQLHSSQYRNPEALPPGSVLVVGSAMSGAQIAEELYLSGRKVYLCVSRAGRFPRVYRGRDAGWWMNEVGILDTTVDDLPSPKAKFDGNGHLSGKDGGRRLNLHQFARDGVILLGHLQAVDGTRIRLAPDLKESLANADKFEADIIKKIDEYIEKLGLDVPEETLPMPQDGFDAEVITELDLAAAGITAVIWATGYSFDYGLVRLPACDADGYPLQKQGITRYPGLYFVGLPWLRDARSGMIWGVGRDAAHIVQNLVGRDR
jgi:putative flavoprotein involved in K+ transport